MRSEPSKQQLKIEVDRFMEMRRSAPSGTDWPENDPIKSYPAEAYRPKSSIKKMITADRYDGLCLLLNELYELNEEHAGEPYYEVSILFAITGIAQPLQDLMLDWAKSFLVSRLEKYNPRDADDEFLRFNRLLTEYCAIFPTLEHSVNDILLGLCFNYAAWFLYEHTLAKVVTTRDIGESVEVGVLVPLDTGMNTYFEECINVFKFGRDDLGAFLKVVLADGVPDNLRKKLSVPDATLRRDIGLMGENITVMRQLLMRDFCSDTTVVRLSRSLVIAVEWSVRDCIMYVEFADYGKGLLERLAENDISRVLHLARDGSLLDSHRPWIRMEDSSPSAEVSGIAVNAYVLELIHDKLFSFYDGIDETGLRDLAATDSIPEDREDEVLAWSCQELAAREPVEMEIGTVDAGAVSGPVATEGDREAVVGEPEAETVEAEPSCEAVEAKPEIGPVETPADEEQPRRRRLVIHHVRLPTFLRILEHNLGCEVRPGKGDETTVFRPGGKIIRIGRPRQVHPTYVKHVLRHLNISVPEWLRAVGWRENPRLTMRRDSR